MRMAKTSVGSVILLLVVLVLGLSPAAQADIKGDCELLNGRSNPGLGCSSSSAGEACTIKGKAGVCTNMKRPISSLYYCVCLPADKEVPEETEGKAVATDRLERRCGDAVTFVADTSSPQIIDSVLPESFGHEVVRLESYEGSFTVKTEPIAGSPDACAIVSLEGELRAPSFLLTDNTKVENNAFRFVSLESGQVNLRTGDYTVVATGAITNSRFSSLPTRGHYHGKVDFEKGTITFDSTTFDAVNDAVPAETRDEPAVKP